MQSLRHFTLLTRLVLVWFVLSLGVAVASPLVHPQDSQLVCTGTGAMKILAATDDGSTGGAATASMDCPLCAPVIALPVVAGVVLAPVLPLSYALQRMPATRLATRTAAPLPARGPPAVL